MPGVDNEDFKIIYTIILPILSIIVIIGGLVTQEPAMLIGGIGCLILAGIVKITSG